jgi:Uncharacterized conserved protein
MSQHTCGCGHDHGEKSEAPAPAPDLQLLNTSEEEVLDVHAIPHFVRHAAILGALASLSPGFALTIKAGHLPAPLLAQAEQLPGSFTYDVLVNGPEFWLVKITRESL